MASISFSDAGSSKSRVIIDKNKMEYEEMRKRLLETEEKLHNLRKLEEEVQSVTSETTDKISSASNYRSRGYKSWSQQDDTDSVTSTTSALSTIPGSYTGFINHRVKASTPSSHQVWNKNQVRLDGFESDSSTDSTKENRSGTSKYERKLLLQNQRLLLEVERLIGDLHHSKLENASLSKDADSSRKVPDLEERIEELIAENKAQDKALREAEQHLDQGSKRTSELQKKLQDYEGDIANIEAEMEEHRHSKKAIEYQRDEAIQNLIEMQDTWEDYQRRSKDRNRKLESCEDDLRDALTSVTQERDDLLEQLTDMQGTVASQEAQINRLLRDMDQEDSEKHLAQEENHKLQGQLDQLTAQISDFEMLTKQGETIRQEKLELEQELSQHRLVARDLGELLEVFSKRNDLNDSCNASMYTSSQELLAHDQYLLSLSAELNRNNNSPDDDDQVQSRKQSAYEQQPISTKPSEHKVAPPNPPKNKKVTRSPMGYCCDKRTGNNVSCPGPGNVGELRSIFSNMDGEIQRMRTDLKQREADDRTYQNLREELRIIMEKAEKGMQRNQELECIIIQLEDNKKSLEAKLTDAIRALEDRDRQNQCLDTRLSERNRQVVCLQEDVNNKSSKISQLETMMRDLKKHMNTVVQTDCSGDLEHAQKKLKDMEEYIVVKEGALADLQNQFVRDNKEAKQDKSKLEKTKHCLTDQIHDFERTLEQMSEENEGLRSKIQKLNKTNDEQKRSFRTKDENIKQLESKLQENQDNSNDKEKLNTKIMEGLHNKLERNQENTKQLESALMMCKQEVAKHLQTLDDIRKHFESEVSHKDGALKHMNELLRKVKEDLNCKVDEVSSMEHSMVQMKVKIEQLFKQLTDEQKNNMCLVDKLKHCEKMNMADKAMCMKDMEDLDRKLSQAINNLNCSQGEINKLKQGLQEKSAMVDCLTIEKNSCCRDLQAIKGKACEMQDHVTKMESDNSELCTQLQHKMECIKDLEKVLCQKDHDLKNCTRCLDELNKKFNSANNNKGDHQQEMRGLVDKLKNATDDLLKKNRLLVECEEALKRCQMDGSGKQDEIDTLNVQLQDLNCKLQERIVKVEELEKAIESIHKETEKRMKRVDEQLRRYECELSEKCRQLTNIDECLTTCQQNLTQKANECCQLEQRCGRLCCDLQTMECKLKDLDEQRVSCCKHLNESKAENAEITQELRVTREELQTQHCELVETRQSLVNCSREVDKSRRQWEECRAAKDKMECELKKICEEKNCLLSKVAHLQCRLEQESSQASKHFNDLKSCMEKELQNCRGATMELEENNSCLMQKLTANQRQLQQVEKCCHQKLDSLNRELEDLLNRLADREDQISALKDSLNLKEAEMMRLKLRLCSCENTCNNNSNTADDTHSPSPLQDRLSLPNAPPAPHGTEGDSDSQASSSARNSLGVSEVQERLRSNHRLQMEIEKQLQSLEEAIPEDSPQEEF